MKNKILVATVFVVIALALSFMFKDQLFSHNKDVGEVTLEWDMSPSPFAGYRIYYGTESGKYNQVKGQGIDIGLTADPAKPKYIVKNLTPGKIYYFAVTTYDANGIESEFSGEVSKVVP